MTLHIHRAERADALVRGLGALLATPPDGPVHPGRRRGAVQGRRAVDHPDAVGAVGYVERRRRLRQRAVPVPGARRGGRARRRAPASTRATTRGPSTGWRGCCSTSSTAAPPEPWCATLGRHLGLLDGQADQGRRVAVGQKLAALFTGYGAQRPAMLRDWAAGRDTDGSGRPARRRPALAGRAVAAGPRRDRHGEPRRAARPGLRPAARRRPTIVDLPERLSVFGPTRLTTEQLTVLDALAEHRDVHLWLPHPSRGAVGRGSPTRGGRGRRRGATTRRRTCRSTRCCGRCAPRRAGAAAAAAGRARARHDAGEAAGRHRARPAAAGPPGGPAPPRPAATVGPVACRCTPATGGSARSRCCARCCSACSPTTRPSSRATSS